MTPESIERLAREHDEDDGEFTPEVLETFGVLCADAVDDPRLPPGEFTHEQVLAWLRQARLC